jgi:hypothetical protein
LSSLYLGFCAKHTESPVTHTAFGERFGEAKREPAIANTFVPVAQLVVNGN